MYTQQMIRYSASNRNKSSFLSLNLGFQYLTKQEESFYFSDKDPILEKVLVLTLTSSKYVSSMEKDLCRPVAG